MHFSLLGIFSTVQSKSTDVVLRIEGYQRSAVWDCTGLKRPNKGEIHIQLSEIVEIIRIQSVIIALRGYHLHRPTARCR